MNVWVGSIRVGDRQHTVIHCRTLPIRSILRRQLTKMAPTPKGVAAGLVSRRISRSPESRASISRGTELSVVFDSTPLLSPTVTPNSSPSFGFQVQEMYAFTTTGSDGIRMTSMETSCSTGGASRRRRWTRAGRRSARDLISSWWSTMSTQAGRRLTRHGGSSDSIPSL